MQGTLKLYIAAVAAAGAIALVATTFLFPLDPTLPIGKGFEFLGSYAAIGGLIFWIVANIVASALPVRMPRGALFAVSVSTLMAATILGGPAAAAWVGLLGSTELRELRGRVPWYGTLSNHAGIVIPATAAAIAMLPFGVPHALVADPTQALADPVTFVAAIVGCAVYLAINASLTAVVVSLRFGHSIRSILFGDARSVAASVVSLAPIGWLMAQIYVIAAWASLLFALPLYMTRSRTRTTPRCARCSPRQSPRSPAPSTSATRSPAGHSGA